MFTYDPSSNSAEKATRTRKLYPHPLLGSYTSSPDNFLNISRFFNSVTVIITSTLDSLSNPGFVLSFG